MAVQISIVLVAIFFIMIFCNIPISVSLGLSTLATMFVFRLPITIYGDIIFSGLAKYTLLSVPFFILAGIIMDRSGISKRIVKFANLCVGPIPGGLAVVSIIVTVFWGAISGSGPATVVALGSILIPAMVNAGYDKAFAAALIAASGAISVIIPPSINLVIYGVLANESIGDLFIGGIVPGLIMGLAFIVYAFIVSVKHGYKGGNFGSKKEIWQAFKDSFWGLLSPVIILGGIYGGFCTPTEAAVIAVFYSLFIGIFVYKDFKVKDIWNILASAGNSSASILIIMANAGVFTWLITSQGIASLFGNMLLGISSNPYVVILVMVFMLLVAGFFIDGISISYIFIPLLLPVVRQLGFSTLWFGVIMVMSIAVGFTTPPVAVNLYPACDIAGIKLSEISKAVVGFVISGIVAIILCVFCGDLVMWLPTILNTK